MITAKFYTTAEGGKWKPFPQNFIFKDRFVPPKNKGLLPLKESDFKIEAAAIMFSDGTIYDCILGKYRDEKDFPPSEFIIYMDTVLNYII